jgi:hypothetical protein
VEEVIASGASVRESLMSQGDADIPECELKGSGGRDMVVDISKICYPGPKL